MIRSNLLRWPGRTAQLRPRLLLLLCLSILTTSARASTREALVAYFDPSLEPLVQRVQSELASDGYAVRVQVLTAPPDCAPLMREPQASPEGAEQASIHVGHAPDSASTGCAVVSYFSPSSGMRQTRVTSSESDAKRFAIKVAEALNGLQSRALARSAQANANIPAARRQEPAHDSEADRRRAGLGALASVLVDANHPRPLLAAGLLAELPFSDRLSLHVDSLWTVTPLRLAEGQSRLLGRFLWTRLSLGVALLSEPLSVKLLAGGGPAFTWVTARVEPPDQARADVGSSAMVSAGGELSYPSRSPIQVGASLRASSMIPSVRFQLPSGPSRPFGSLVGEASVGLVASW